ncbi:MAG: hypothetical protein R3300_15955 [Candidatus Promineifilaceae bacterium]|nr:hypothetical protein [Candidatus Promineifilaceae bacterium]
MGLVARALEMEGVATVVVAWNGGRIRLVNPPRALITKLGRGLVFGQPGDTAQQRRVLESTLTLLTQDAPLDPVYLEES